MNISSNYYYYFLIISILLVQTKGFYLVTQKEWRDISANLSDKKNDDLEQSTIKLHLNVYSNPEKLQNEEENENYHQLAENVLAITDRITSSIKNLMNATNEKIDQKNVQHTNNNNNNNKIKRIFHRQINTSSDNLDKDKMNLNNIVIHSAGDVNDLSETKSIERIHHEHDTTITNYKSDLNEFETKSKENYSDNEKNDINLLEQNVHTETVEKLYTKNAKISSEEVNTDELQDDLSTHHVTENIIENSSTTIKDVMKNSNEDHLNENDSEENFKNGTNVTFINEVPIPLAQVQYSASKEIELQAKSAEDNEMTTTHFEQDYYTTEVNLNEENTSSNHRHDESITFMPPDLKQNSEESITFMATDSKQESEEKNEVIPNDESNTELHMMTTVSPSNEIETYQTVPTVYQEDKDEPNTKVLHKKEIKFYPEMLEEENTSKNPTTTPEIIIETSSPVSKKDNEQTETIESQENETESSPQVSQNDKTEVDQIEPKQNEIQINAALSQEEKIAKNPIVNHVEDIETSTIIMSQDDETENDSKTKQETKINVNSPTSQEEEEVRKHSEPSKEEDIELSSTTTSVDLIDSTNHSTTEENLTPSNIEYSTETNPSTTPEESTMIVSTTCENPTENTPMTTVTATTEQYTETTKRNSDMHDMVEKYKKLSEIPYNDIRNNDDGYPPIIELGTSPLHDNLSIEKFRYERDHGIGHQSETDSKINSKENSGKFLYHPLHDFGSKFGNFLSNNKENLNLNPNAKVSDKLTKAQVDQNTDDVTTTEDPFLTKLKHLNSPPLLIDLSALKKPDNNHKNVHSFNPNTKASENLDSPLLHVNPKRNSEIPTNLYSKLDNIDPTPESSPDIHYETNPKVENVENYGNGIVSKPKSSILKKLSSSTLLQNLSQRNKMPHPEQENHRSLIGKISRNSPTVQRASFSNLKASNIDFMKNLKRETVTTIPKKTELNSAERAEKLSQAFDKFMQVVHVVGEVDNYFSNRVKSSIKRLAKLCDDEEVM